MCQTLFQPHRLDRQYFLAPLRARTLIGRNERRLREHPRQLHIFLFHFHGKRHAHERSIRVSLEGRILPPLADDAFQVKLRINDLVFISRSFFEDCPVLRDDIVPAEHNVRGGFPFPGIGVHIPRDQPCGLSGDQLPAVSVLSDRLIAGRTVDDHSRSLDRRLYAGRHRRPHVLADLRGYDQVFHAGSLEQDLGAKEHLLPLEQDISCLVRSRRKLPHLIELRIVREKCLCRKSEDFPPVQRSRGIVKLPPYSQRHPHKCKDIFVLRVFCDMLQRPARRLEEYVLGKKIPACISSDAELREYDDLCFPFACLSDRPAYILCIVFHISHPDVRRSCRHFYKSMSHLLSTFLPGQTFSPGPSSCLLVCVYCFGSAASAALGCLTSTYICLTYLLFFSSSFNSSTV